MTDQPATDSSQRISLGGLLDQCGVGGDDNPFNLPQSWTQGRTAFGGVSTALAYHAASQIEDDLPPLRSAQIAFTGPLFGKLTAETKMLRRGRSTAFVQSDLFSEKGLGLHANFIFAASRRSEVQFHEFPAPDFPPLPKEEEVRSGPEQFFTSNMEFVGKRADTSKISNRLYGWIRLKDREGLDPFAEVLCMGDAIPVSILALLGKNAPFSSMSWQINMIADLPRTENGWWYVGSTTHDAHGGSASQYMAIWNSERELMATGMQSVAYYA